jgi:arabinofuranan 3-O-arabinosyltransferase
LTIGLRSYKVARVKEQQLEALNGMCTLRKKYGLFTERGLALYASGVAIGFVISLARRLLTPFEDQNCIDFKWIWLSSHFAAGSFPVRAYDYSAFTAAKAALIGPPECILEHFDNAPGILFFVYPLHLFPYGIAFALWIAATLGIYLMSVYVIVPHRNALIVAFTVLPAWMNIRLGHDGFLTAGLLGLSLAFAETRPKLAGMFLSLLTYKPQFGILFPPALAVSRNWRALVAGTIASAAFAIMATLAFGYEIWPAFMHAVRDRASALNEDPKLALPLSSVLSLLWLGVNSKVVWAIQLTIAAVAAGTVCLMWARPYPYALKAAALAAGSLIVSPHVISYDLCILTISAAFFVKDGLARGFLRGERTTLLMCWIALYLFIIGPVPLLVCMVMLGLAVRRELFCPVEEPAATQANGLKNARA